MSSRALVCLLALLIAVMVLPAAAQPFDHIVVIQPVKHDASPEITELLPGKVGHERHEVPLMKPGHGRGGPPSGGGGGGFTDPVLQSSTGASSASSGFTHIFNGQGNDSDAYAPPDTNGAAGPYQYVQTVNVTLAAYDKSGGLVYGPATLNTLWSGFGGACESNNGGDPIVQYDKINGRWVVLQIQYSGGRKGGNYICMAVSNGNDWSASNFSWQRYAYKFNTLTDYPKLGIWNDAYYVTFNAFKGFGTYAGPVVCAFDLGSAGATGNSLCTSLSTAYASLLPADIDSTSQAPVAGEPEYLVSLGSPLLSWRFHLDLPALRQGNSGTSSMTSAQAVTVSSATFPSGLAFQYACGSGGSCVPQPGTSQQLDSLGERLMYRLAYRNFGGYESLVATHSVQALSTGVTGIRWYEMRNTPSTSSTTPYVYQAGTYAPDSSYRWMGSVAMDASGNIAAGYSASSSNLHPSIYTAVRCSADAPNTLGAESLVQLGTGSQTGLNRWGDYASMSVDPVDGSLWFTTEYLVNDGSFNWHTKIANFHVTGCP
jgi:hypothetical protein